MILGSITLLSPTATVWDAMRGKGLPQGAVPSPGEIGRLDHLATQLIQSQWAVNTRVSYNAWFSTWQEFANIHGFPVIPAQEVWMLRYFTLLACHYSAATVEVAAASMVAVHKVNNMPNPIAASVAVHSLVKSIKKNGMVSSRAQKLIIETSFVVSMCSQFLQWYPVYDDDVFDPRQENSQSIMWMRGVAIILIGLACGLRPGEVTKLTVCCWEHALHGSVFLHVKLAKNGINGVKSGAYMIRDEGGFAENYSAISFFEEFWFPFLARYGIMQTGSCTHLQHQAAHCSACPPLFPTWPALRVGQLRAASTSTVGIPRAPAVRSLTTSAISDVVKQWAKAIGKEYRRYSGISFRRGSISLAAAEKVARNIRKKQCRWRSDNMQDHYTVPTVEEQLEYGKALQKMVRRTRVNKSKQVHFDE